MFNADHGHRQRQTSNPELVIWARCGKSVNPTVRDEETVQEPLEEAQEDTENKK